MLNIRAIGGAIGAALTFCDPAAAQEPFQLDRAIGAPHNLRLSVNYRTRYEFLDGRFRSGFVGSDQALVERLLLAAEYDFGGVYVGAEVQDSRQQRADAGTPVGTDDVNAFEVLRGYIGYRKEGAFLPGDRLDVTAGRITIDVGSRRLAARNRFRNTINGFAGLHARWSGPGGNDLQVFYTSPVARRPADAESLLENDVSLDEENLNRRFWGLHLTRSKLFHDLTGEIYLFGLHEDDREEFQTRDRDLFTPGFRLYKEKSISAFDYEVETALQFGQSSLSSSPDAPRLDTFAHFHHLHLGYTFDNNWRTRVLVQYEFASGDRNPDDGDNTRFDTLFGARRFELGPTGIYGALARSNLNAPGARIEFKPDPRLQGFVGYRAAFLAAGRDAMTTAGVQDSSGASGNFIGHQFETRLRYDLVPGNTRLEAGLAYLMNGRFLETAPNASPSGDSFYAYSQISLSF